LQVGIQLISLDDAAYINNALESVIPLQPAYVAIADGGSTDGTIEIVESYRNKLNILFEQFPWRNHFGNQRNNALAMSPPVDWFIRLDTDEVLTEPMIAYMRSALSKLPASCLAIRIKQVNVYPRAGRYAANLGGWETHPRIFRGQLPEPMFWKWQGQVHEYLCQMTQDGLKPIPEQLVWDWNVSVAHWGWVDLKRRRAREVLYSDMPGSGIGMGDLTANRHYEIRDIPHQVDVVKETE
jgi:glycosyltransferase involved in cell wall biosynthesis